jgi:hypothetical protein
MDTKRLAIVGAVALVMAGATSRAEAGNLPFKGSLSGTISSTEMDLDPGGEKNGLLIGGAKSTLGSSTFQGPSGEFVDSDFVTCPSGYGGFAEVTVPAGGTAGLVFRFDSTGDLLFERDTSFTGCISNTGIFFGSGRGDITGGTGRFAAATGSLEYPSCTGNVLFIDDAGRVFDSITCEFNATINTHKQGGGQE